MAPFKRTAPKLSTVIQNKPTDNALNFIGWFDRMEKSMLPLNALTRGTYNCFIPTGDKIVPRPGSQRIGQAATEDSGMKGHQKKYKNLGGIEMEVRAFRSTVTNLNDVIQVLFNGTFVPITETPNPIPKGAGKIYFAVYSDTDLDPSVTRNLPRLTWVDGYMDPVTRKGRVCSWTGGIAVIDNVTPTNIELPTGETWRSIGFTENASGDAFVVISGTAYQLVDPTDLDTNSIEITGGTTGITAGEIATSQIEVDELPIPFDINKQSQGYMFYGNEDYQSLYQSNAYGRPSLARINGAQAAQNDLIISDATDYTGTGRHIYKITISSTTPAKDTQRFVGTGSNSSYFDSSGYNASGTRRYRISIISDITLTPTGPTPALVVGEYIIGNTSGAIVKVADLSGIGAFSGTVISGIPVVGETFTGQQSGTTTTAIVSIAYFNSAYYYRQIGNTTTWTQITGIVGMLPSGALQFPNAGTYTLNDGLTFEVPQAGSNFTGDYYELEIQTEAPDEFVWQKDTGPVSAPIAITGSDQAIDDGLVIKFVEPLGHSVGNYWTIEVNQKIDRAWANFYYSIDIQTQNSVRRPGEGYIYKLPSNFWTMGTLEDSLLINGNYGEWGYISSILSADLLSEEIKYTPLKTAGANKVLYPYLMGNSQNDLLFINENHQLTSIGRIQLTEKLQLDYLSDAVRNAFNEASFVDGSFEYQDKKIWITSPNDFIMFCYDDAMNYWQPPQVIPDNALLTTIGNSLATHSSSQNVTNILNDKTAIGDNGAKYMVSVKTGASSFGDRWLQKSCNETFWEAYLYTKPERMDFSVYFDLDDPSRIKTHQIQPVPGRANISSAVFGGGNMGNHSFGSDEFTDPEYFRELYTKLGVQTFYFAALGFTCEDKIHDYELLSLGINAVESTAGNKQWIPREEKLLPDFFIS